MAHTSVQSNKSIKYIDIDKKNSSGFASIYVIITISGVCALALAAQFLLYRERRNNDVNIEGSICVYSSISMAEFWIRSYLMINRISEEQILNFSLNSCNGQIYIQDENSKKIIDLSSRSPENNTNMYLDCLELLLLEEKCPLHSRNGMAFRASVNVVDLFCQNRRRTSSLSSIAKNNQYDMGFQINCEGKLFYYRLWMNLPDNSIISILTEIGDSHMRVIDIEYAKNIDGIDLLVKDIPRELDRRVFTVSLSL